MVEKRPFLEDGSQFGVSRTQFRQMKKADKRDLMVAWFHQNYEDPAQRTMYVSAEGGYLWNHGGPYNASEQLYDMFGDLASEKLIEEVVEEVESSGISEWAPVHDEYDEDEELPDDPRPSFEDFSDEPNDQYGSPRDLAARERARRILKELVEMLDEPRPVGIGHNNPPEEIEKPESVKELCASAAALEIELGTPEPSISLVKKLGSALAKAARASIKWGGQKVDLAINTAIKTGIPAVGTIIAATYNDQIHKAIDVVIHWLQIVAHAF